ncbi:prepilin peptidase [Candidatus Regiella endosymbiont of Tuberolachnus salignus]|uniref:prepilin peptidase n=1 Tax=Candidatus Regiella endosymbiont of Tuberolachnus salignus TaxID=3077956 RepID=UPI0030D559B2
MLFCTLLPIFLLLGHYLITEARHCIGDIEGTLPTRLPFAVVLMTLFAGVASFVSTRGILLGQSWLLVLRDLLLLGWSVLLTQLDVARGWLPFRNTGGLIFSGLLFSLLPQAPVPFLQAMREGGVMFLGLSLFRGWVNRHGVERFGLGDVYLLSGLSLWLTLPVTASLTLWALGFVVLHVVAGKRGVVPQVRDIPFAPYLCGCLAVAILMQPLPG